MSNGLSGPAPDERPTPQGRRTPEGVRIDPEAEAQPEIRRTTLSALVKHEPGVLAEVSTLFSRRQFNIESLTVGPTTDPDRARITMVVEEPEPGVEQAKKQLAKLLPVVSVTELGEDSVERELALIKVDGERPDEVHAVAEVCDARTVDVGPRALTVEVTGTEPEVDRAIEAFERFGVREVVRTGTAALARGTNETANTTGEP